MASSRRYDIILLGATGYTGQITAEYLHQHLSTKYKWAIAGRSQSKLAKINTTLTSLSSTRATPDILTANLNVPDLTNLAKQTRLLINCIGPYHLYSTPVVQACAETGTHYLDVTGETPWIYDVLEKYEATAKKSGAVIIPSCGLESAPSDVLAYVATKLIRDVWDCGVADMVGSVHELKWMGPSGGTLASAMGLMDHYSLSYLQKVMSNPFILSPIGSRDYRHTKYPQPASYTRTILQKLTGVWSYPLLGKLTTSVTAKPNVSIVQRSAGLNQSFYSYNFTYEEYMRISNVFLGFITHLALLLVPAILMIPPIRHLARRFATAPGSGPARGKGRDGYIELRGVAVAEQLSKTHRKALASVRFDGGSAYEWTAITVSEAAVALLEGLNDVRAKFGGGFLTPACLGDRYVSRLEGAGVKITVKQIGETATTE